jgi:hypothetical protein
LVRLCESNNKAAETNFPVHPKRQTHLEDTFAQKAAFPLLCSDLEGKKKRRKRNKKWEKPSSTNNTSGSIEKMHDAISLHNASVSSAKEKWVTTRRFSGFFRTHQFLLEHWTTKILESEQCRKNWTSIQCSWCIFFFKKNQPSLNQTSTIAQDDKIPFPQLLEAWCNAEQNDEEPFRLELGLPQSSSNSFDMQR